MTMRSPKVAHDGPSSSRLAYLVGRLYLKVAGWDVKGELPAGGRGVLIAAPHTSNWDLPYMLAVAWVFRLKLNWLGKHTLFEKPVRGAFMRWLGGIGVDRRAPHGVVGQAAQRLIDSDGMYLAVAPAGTRAGGKHWKSGFYHIAHQAQVPIVCGFLDFGKKLGGVGPSFVPTGDINRDMDIIREFYRDMTGQTPGKESPIVLREELATLQKQSDAEAQPISQRVVAPGVETTPGDTAHP